MKIISRAGVVLSLVPIMAFAQTNIDGDLNAELDRLYQSTKAQSASVQSQSLSPSVQVNVQTSRAATEVEAQKQPTTYIEAAPLSDSKADRMRKSRQDAEAQTESQIVEKLEQSRLEDEKRRADALFGDRFNALEQKAAPAAPVVQEQQQAPTIMVVPMQNTEVEKKVAKDDDLEKELDRADRLDREALRGEIRAALDEHSQANKKPASKSFVGGLVGSADYPNAINTRGQYALGVTAGSQAANGFIVEGSFIYSSHELEQPIGGTQQFGVFYPRITQVDQYNIGGGVRYQFLTGAFRPTVGGLMSYTYRNYTDTQFSLSNDSLSTQAIDAGVSVGIDLEVSENFSIGLDYRRMMNLTTWNDGGLRRSWVQNNQQFSYNEAALEKIGYYTLGLVGRATF